MLHRKRLALIVALVALPLSWGVTLTSAAPPMPAPPPTQSPVDVNVDKIKDEFKAV